MISLLIALTIALLTSKMTNHPLAALFTASLKTRTRLLEPISTKTSPRASSAAPPLQLLPLSCPSNEKLANSVYASIIEALTQSPRKTLTLFPTSTTSLIKLVTARFSRSLISGMHSTSSAFAKAMSGRTPSTLLKAFMSTLSCPSPMPLLSFSRLFKTRSADISAFSVSSTSTTSWSFLPPSQNMTPTSNSSTTNSKMLDFSITPPNVRLDIMHQHHDAVLGGHPGRTITLNKVLHSYSWPGLYTFVRRYVLAGHL